MSIISITSDNVLISRHWLVIASCVFVGLVTAACDGKSSQKENSSPLVSGDHITLPTDAGASIQTAIIAESSDHDVELSGRVAWDEDRTVRIFSPFSGRVIRIIAELGDRVKAGQPLAILDSPDYGSAQTDYRKAVAAQTLTQASLSRATELFEHGIIPKKDLEQAQSDDAQARAEVDRAHEVLQQFSDAGNVINQQMILRSPIEGVVVSRAINPGQELRTDQSGDPLFTVTNPDAVWLSLDANEDQLPALKAGMTVRFSVRSDANDTEHTGKILRVADMVDPNSRTIKVLATADNSTRSLKGDMFVTAHVRVETLKTAFVPADAVYLAEGHHYVFVKDGDGFAKREVALGSSNNAQLSIHEGLKPGEIVVTHGALFLQQMLDSKSKG
jgi:membrane fusion protein, heavy metal efflux system